MKHDSEFHDIVEAAGDALLVVDADGTIVFANAAAVPLFGRTRDRLVGGALGHPVVAGSWAEIEIASERGNLRLAEMRASAIVWRGNSAWVVSLRDVTDRRELEHQLRRAQRLEALGRLAGGVAHDFNNLLTVITGSVTFLGERFGADPDLEAVEAAVSRAARLTEQLLTFSRSRASAIETVDVGKLLVPLMSMLRRIIGENIQVSFFFAPALWTIDVDPARLEQVLMNLAVNARDAMESGGKLTISAQNAERAGEPMVAIVVEDTGAGIAGSVLPHIFEPLFTTKDPGKGTGLGLSTVYGIVTQLGGTIDVDTTLGEGTTFTVWFPRSAAEQTPSAEPSTPEILLPQVDRARGILLVEDEIAVREVVGRLLEGEGYRVFKCAHAEEALEFCEAGAEHVDLLLTDIMMPFMRGDELARRMRGHFPHIRVVFMSGYSEDMQSILTSAATFFLPKPFARAELLEILGRAFERSGPQEAARSGLSPRHKS